MNNLYGFVKSLKDGDTQSKNKIRTLSISIIHEFFLEHGIKKVRFLTLPSAWWIFEREISKRFFDFRESRIRPRFISCERDYNLFKLASVRMPKSNKQMRVSYYTELNCEVVTNGSDYVLIFADVWEFIKITDKKFDCIWLDLITPLSYWYDKITEIGKVLNDRSIVIFTFLKGRGHAPLPNDREKTVSDKMNSMGFTLKKEWDYADKSPMKQLIYTR